ncbi:helix-turn-helix transcriptional regulator [Viridibacillus arvi]|uniref:helix-turn-helix transcriptional regulator n=1 Tax=Viridibacillus arvi TaxID=263475 RepID=UPI00367893DB
MRKWLKQKRIENRLTQEEVASSVDIARTTYASYEQGERNPSVNIAKKLAQLLEFDWTLFFETEVHEMCIYDKQLA